MYNAQPCSLALLDKLIRTVDNDGNAFEALLVEVPNVSVLMNN